MSEKNQKHSNFIENVKNDQQNEQKKVEDNLVKQKL